ncbi:MAG: tetratricopeptide repeat protein [Desulfotignum sp.]|nr:tetratricopeptide repeat protein [Desulfotignum sp.]
MVNQNVSNERKKELQQLDPLQRNLLKAMAYAGTYKKQLLLILGAMVLVAVVFAGIMISFQRSENTASNLVAEAMNRYNTLADDPKAAYQAVRQDFHAVLNDYANTSAGRMAQVRYAGICMDAQEYDKALEWYEKALENVGKQAEMRNFLLSSLGHAWLAKNNQERAEFYFKQIETGKSDLLKDESRFVLAKIYESRQNTSASKKMYEMLVKEHADSIYLNLAQDMIDPVSVQ